MKEVTKTKQSSEFEAAASFVSDLRVKTVAGFIAFLTLVYSVFGSIYRIPMQVDQQREELIKLAVKTSVVFDRIIEVEKQIVSQSSPLLESTRTRNRVDALEQAVYRQTASEEQIKRLERIVLGLSDSVDGLSSQTRALERNVIQLQDSINKNTGN